jgi:hypothetical protein
MEKDIMRKNLPYLNQDRLNTIFDHVYDIVSDEKNESAFNEKRLSHLLETLKSMQSFNYQYRPDDTRALFELMNKIFKFEKNSEGTTLWLSLILAIKELYGFSDTSLPKVMKQTTIRK